MNPIQKSFLIVGLSFSSLFADQGKVADLKMYSAVYPASSALGIPFNGKVVFNSPNELAKGEHWFSVEHLPIVKELAAKYFKDIEVLASDDKEPHSRVIGKRGMEIWVLKLVLLSLMSLSVVKRILQLRCRSLCRSLMLTVILEEWFSHSTCKVFHGEN